MSLSRTQVSTAVLFFFALSFAFFSLQATDIFMYLSLARDVLLKGHWWIQSDPYLYSLSHATLTWWHEYLSYLFVYGAWWLGGYAGILVLKLALLAILFALVLHAEPKKNQISLFWVALWILAVIAASFRFVARTSLVSDVFALLIVGWLLEAHHLHRRLAVKLALLFFFWIQFHAGFPLGLLLLFVWSAWHLIFNPQFKVKDMTWMLAPLAALFLNPLGYRGVIYPFEFALNEAQTLKHFNFEWFPAYHPAFILAPETIAFWILSLLGLYLIVREKAWYSLRAWFSVLAIALAIQAVRFIPWASFTLLICLKPWSEWRKLRGPRWALPALLSLLTLVAVKNLIFGYSSSAGWRTPRFGIDQRFFPTATLDFYRKLRLPGHLYNSHSFGAYLIWQGLAPVFHHGFVTDMDFYRNDVMGVFQGQKRFLELADKYHWTMLLVDKPNSYPYFYRILGPLKDWKIVAEDPAAYLIYKIPSSAPLQEH